MQKTQAIEQDDGVIIKSLGGFEEVEVDEVNEK